MAVLGLVVIDVGISQIVGIGIGPINGIFMGRVGMLIVGNGTEGDIGGAGNTCASNEKKKNSPKGSHNITGLFPQYANILLPSISWPVETNPSAFRKRPVSGS